MKKILSILLALAMVLSLCSFGAFAEEVAEETAYVAKIGSREYTTLANAIGEAGENDTIELITSVEIAGITIDKDVTINLKDKEITSSAAINIAGNVTIKNGTITGTEEGGVAVVLKAAGGTVEFDDIEMTAAGDAIKLEHGFDGQTLTINKSIIESARGEYAVIWSKSHNSTVNIVESTVLSDGYVTLYHNGSYKGFDLNITKSTVTTKGEPAIFVSGQSNYTEEEISSVDIIDSKVTGISAVEVKFADLTIGEDEEDTSELIAEGAPSYSSNGSGTSTTGYAIASSDNSGDGYTGGSIVINGGCFYGAIDVVATETEDPEVTRADIAVKGGNFTIDPSANIAKGYARSASEVEGYVYRVIKLENEDVQVAPVAPKVEISEEIDEEIKTEIETNAYKATIDGIDDVVNTAAGQVETSEATAALEAAEIDVAEDATVNIFVQPSLDVEVKGVEDGTLVLDIKAMVQTYATTAETVYDMVIGTDAVAVGDPVELEVKEEVVITIPVPASIIDGAEVLIVKHIKDEDEVYYYEVTVNEDNTITFINPHGFSEFEVSALDEEALTMIMEFSYNDKPVKDTRGDTIEDAEYTLYDIGTEIELPTAKKTGYTFKGWKFGRDNETYKDDVVLTQEIWDMADEGVLKVTAVFKKNADKDTGLGGGGGDVVTTYTVAFDTDGGSQIESIRVHRGNKVAVPAAPEKEGFTFGGWYTDEECIKKYDFSNQVYSSFTLYAKWLGESESLFADVAQTDWFYENVNEAYSKGLMNGMDAENFGPGLEINRAMFVTVLHRIDGETEAKADASFSDVPKGAYYENAVAWAVSTGIVEGYGDGAFGSNDPITREQMAVMLYRFAQYKGVQVGGTGMSFSDADSIAEWAKAAVDWATNAGVLNGMGDGTYAPKATATRAQGAAVFVRIEDLVK